jgi:hypothetical protein
MNSKISEQSSCLAAANSTTASLSVPDTWYCMLPIEFSALPDYAGIAVVSAEDAIVLEDAIEIIKSGGTVHTQVISAGWGTIAVQVFQALMANIVTTYIDQLTTKKYDPVASIELLMQRFIFAIQDIIDNSEIRAAQGREAGVIMDMRRYAIDPNHYLLNSVLGKITENIGIVKTLPSSAVPTLVFAAADYGAALLQMGEITERLRNILVSQKPKCRK